MIKLALGKARTAVILFFVKINSNLFRFMVNLENADEDINCNSIRILKKTIILSILSSESPIVQFWALTNNNIRSFTGFSMLRIFC